MATFKRKNVDKILAGLKTQTRRTHVHEWKIGHVYGLRDRWFDKPKGHILITRKYRQRLGNISPEEISKEGFQTMEEFRSHWENEIMRQPDSWHPDEIVIAYEFRVVSKPRNWNLVSLNLI